eukprot:GILK01004101.1.p1 GENE.GILK01004101.1~~GILK01004101.1.p1  ORF type:complete len:490 (+),score=59.42 GILK01004101.1:37-1470(+)
MEYEQERRPLVPHSTVVQFGRRERHDTGFTIFYLLCCAATLGLGIFVCLNANRDITSQYDKCEADVKGGKTPTVESSTSLGSAAPIFIGVAILASILGAIWVWLLKKYSLTMVWVSCFLIPVGLALLGAMIFITGSNKDKGIVCFILVGIACLLLWVLFCIREKVRLTAAIIAESCRALETNTSIIGVSVGIMLVGFALIALLVVFGIFAVMNATVVNKQTYCDYDIQTAGKVTLAFIFFFGAWTVFLLHNIFLFTVSGAAAIWYFNEDHHTETGNPTLASLKYAVTSSFGSLAFGSLILAVVEFILMLLQSSRDENGERNLVTECCISCVRCIQDAIAFLNKFAIVYMAIKGQSFLDSARSFFVMLQNNGMNCIVVDSLSNLVLGVNVVLMSALSGVLGYAIMNATGNYTENSEVTGAVVSAIIALLILSLLSGIIASLINSIFVCYVMDKDQRQIHRPDVHEVFKSKNFVRPSQH